MWRRRFRGDYACPAVDGHRSEAQEGDPRFCAFFVENRATRTALVYHLQVYSDALGPVSVYAAWATHSYLVKTSSQTLPHAPSQVVFKRRPAAARYLFAHGEAQRSVHPPTSRWFRDCADSLKHDNFARYVSRPSPPSATCAHVRVLRGCVCRYRLLRRRVPGATPEELHLFRQDLSQQQLDVGRMVGPRRAPAPVNTRHFTSGMPSLTAQAEEASVATVDPWDDDGKGSPRNGGGDSDCDGDDGQDPYVNVHWGERNVLPLHRVCSLPCIPCVRACVCSYSAQAFAQSEEGQRLAREKRVQAARAKREATRTLGAITLPTVEMLLRYCRRAHAGLVCLPIATDA